MKVNLVKVKNKVGHRDPYAEFFDFDYDRFQLTISTSVNSLCDVDLIRRNKENPFLKISMI